MAESNTSFDESLCFVGVFTVSNLMCSVSNKDHLIN